MKGLNLPTYMEEREFIIFVLIILYHLWFKTSSFVNANFKELPPT